MYCIPSDDDDTGSIMKQQFDVFATSLPTCVNRDLIDKVGQFVVTASGSSVGSMSALYTSGP